MTSTRLKKVDDCFYLDESGQIYFSVSNFLRVNDLPNHPLLKIVVIEELLDIFPEAEILDV
jgi:hypothetical protein